MWVIEAYFVWEAVSEALFWVSVGNFGWVGVDGPHFWVGGVGGDMWGIILGGCGWGWWVGKYFGWVGLSGGGCNVWYHLMAIVLWSVKHGQ